MPTSVMGMDGTDMERRVMRASAATGASLVPAEMTAMGGRVGEGSGGVGGLRRAARAGLSGPWIGDRIDADKFWMTCDPDKQSGPRCIEVLFFVAPGNGEHVWQCLELTCGVTVAF